MDEIGVLTDATDHVVHSALVIFEHGIVCALIDDFGHLVGVGYGIFQHCITKVFYIDIIEQGHEYGQDQGYDQGEFGDQAEAEFHELVSVKRMKWA